MNERERVACEQRESTAETKFSFSILFKNKNKQKKHAYLVCFRILLTFENATKKIMLFKFHFAFDSGQSS